MGQGIEQQAHGDGNIQVGRDVILKVFSLSGASQAETIRAIDGYLAFFYLVLIGCLGATTMPSAALNTVSSLGAVGILLMVGLLHWERRRIAGTRCPGLRKFQFAALALVGLSLFTGCGGTLFGKATEMAQVCSDISGTICRSGTAQGVGILGFGLDQVNLEGAVKAGGLNKVITSSEIRGYGLISMARVTVYGE